MRYFKIILAVFAINSFLYASEDIPTEAEVAKLYVATFNRAPDEAGLNYWVKNSGLTLSSIAKSFFDQNETKELYPEETTNHNFIDSIYQNLFNRQPDEAGWNYWEDELNTTRISKDLFILSVINGVKDGVEANDAVILENKTEAGLYFANEGLSDINLSKIIMQNITTNSYTIDYSKAMVNILTGSIVFATDISENNLSNKNFTLFETFNQNGKMVFEFYIDGSCAVENNGSQSECNWSIEQDKIVVIDNSNFIYYLKIQQTFSYGDIVNVNNQNYTVQSISPVLYSTNYIKHEVNNISNALTSDGENIIFGNDYGEIYKYSPTSKISEKLFDTGYYSNSIELVGDILYAGSMHTNAILKYSYPDGELLGTEVAVHFPDGLGVKDNMLYSVQSDSNGELLVVDLNSSNQYKLETIVPDPVGVSYYNQALYILDESGDIYKYDFVEITISKTFSNTKFHTSSSQNTTGLEGITIIDGKIWVSFINDGNLYQLDVEL